MNLCAISDCGRKHYAKGMCAAHYHRQRTTGRPEGSGRAVRGDGVAFLEKALVHQSDECLIWPFGCNGDGYPEVWLNGKGARGHAIICERAHGPKPPDKDHAAHSCGNRPCMNHRHLRWATHAENMQDKRLHGTQRNGWDTRRLNIGL